MNADRTKQIFTQVVERLEDTDKGSTNGGSGQQSRAHNL
jgi:hypothetical protein